MGKHGSATVQQSGSRGVGGARRDRTDDLLLAKQALSQLSYGPGRKPEARNRKPDLHQDGGLVSGFWSLASVA
jgi:hypothetical protein